MTPTRPSQKILGDARPATPDPETLPALAQEVRQFLEPRWLEGLSYDTPPPTPSTGNCLLSSEFLRRVCSDAGYDARLRFGNESGTGFLAHGTMMGHSWVEAGNRICDITADQFKEPPVIVTSTDDPRYKAEEGELTLTKGDERIIAAWMKAWKAEGQATKPAPAPAPARQPQTPRPSR